MAKGVVADVVKAVGAQVGKAVVEIAKAEAVRAVEHFKEGRRKARTAERDPRTIEHQAPAGDAPQSGARPRLIPIDINTASRSQLVTLKGIGPARADAIIKARPFASSKDLLERRVIPAGVLAAIQEEIRVG